jgi:hypothetical protein
MSSEVATALGASKRKDGTTQEIHVYAKQPGFPKHFAEGSGWGLEKKMQIFQKSY